MKRRISNPGERQADGAISREDWIAALKINAALLAASFAALGATYVIVARADGAGDSRSKAAPWVQRRQPETGPVLRLASAQGPIVTQARARAPRQAMPARVCPPVSYRSPGSDCPPPPARKARPPVSDPGSLRVVIYREGGTGCVEWVRAVLRSEAGVMMPLPAAPAGLCEPPHTF